MFSLLLYLLCPKLLISASDSMRVTQWNKRSVACKPESQWQSEAYSAIARPSRVSHQQMAQFLSYSNDFVKNITAKRARRILSLSTQQADAQPDPGYDPGTGTTQIHPWRNHCNESPQTTHRQCLPSEGRQSSDGV